MHAGQADQRVQFDSAPGGEAALAGHAVERVAETAVLGNERELSINRSPFVRLWEFAITQGFHSAFTKTRDHTLERIRL